MINIPYGKSYQPFQNDGNATILQPKQFENNKISESEIVQKALENPIDSARLSKLAEDKQKIVLITSDHTRPVPSKITMPLLLSEIRSKNPNAEIVILIATGLHRATTESELRSKFGDEIVDHEKIIIHDARNPKDLTYFGELPSGGELWLNKLIKEADLVVAKGLSNHTFSLASLAAEKP